MCNLEFWNTFVQYTASSEFTHKTKLQEVFIERFRHENWELEISSIADLLEWIDNHDDPEKVEKARGGVSANLRRIYRHFNECNYAEQNRRFPTLLRWLQENRYPQWLEEHLNETSSASNSQNRYIERPPIEEDFYEEALTLGAFIRLKAPYQMGKTLLIDRILTKLTIEEEYTRVIYDFGLEDSEVFQEYERFVRCFCTGVADELDLNDCLAEHWGENRSNNKNVSRYFERYLLARQDRPLVFVLRRLDRVFEHDNIRLDFCSLLTGWYRLCQQNNNQGDIWRRTRIILSHSTDVYGSFDINRSPLAGIGTVFLLREFNAQQVREFASSYGLELSDLQIERLMELIGGFPYLLEKAFEYLQINSNSWEDFLNIATTESSPFIEHLRRNLQILQANEELKQSFMQILNSQQPIFLRAEHSFKLLGMGLIRLIGNECICRCSLYRHYFPRHLN